MDLTFIIPTLNEQQHLPTTIESIKKYVPNSFNYEIIIVDHGSNDSTVSIAKSYNCLVIIGHSATIAGQRNLGASYASGEILIFLDADVHLTEEWAHAFKSTYNLIITNNNIITGSWCEVSSEAPWIEYFWFTPPRESNPRHIGTGHLVLHKDLFSLTGGFDECLETGEDYDLSERAIKLNAIIFDDPALKVIHEDYPKDIFSFIKREAWHGRSDFNSLTRLIKSKVALATIFFILLHIIFIASLIFNISSFSILAFCLIIVLCVSTSIKKYHNSRMLHILINSFIYYLYFLGRSISFFRSLLTNL